MPAGYARPTLGGPGDFDYLDIGVRDNPVIKWRPIGNYVEAGINWTWGLEPGTFAFELHPKHPLNDDITTRGGIMKTAYHFRAAYHGVPFTGRIMKRQITGPPGREKYLYSGVCNKYWLQRGYGWVNNLFPPEIQIGLTGKQDIRFGPIDMVTKTYVTSVFTRLDKPVYSKLPVRWPTSWTQPELDDIDSIDDLLDLIFDAVEEVEVLMARFTRLDELFGGPFTRLERGCTLDLWDGTGTPPQAAVLDGVADLQSIIDHNGDSFLDLSKLLDAANDGLWSDTPNRACYLFDTHEKRDNRKVQFRTDGGQIQTYDYTETHADVTRAIVGGKAPSFVNDLIEIAANLAIAAIISGLSLIPGLAGIGGLSVTVGDLFDDIFFAYQVFADNDLENAIGDDDAFAEDFADNTAAWTIDSYSVGKTHLHDHAGKQTLDITALSGLPDGKGNSFGVDNGTARRYRLGDIISFYDRGNVVEKYVSGFSVTSKPGERMREGLTVGDDKRAKGAWTRLITGVQGLGATSRGLANST